MCAQVALSGECIRGYKPDAVVSSRLAPRVAASCLNQTLFLRGLRAGICCAVLRGSLCVCIIHVIVCGCHAGLKGDYYYYY